MTQLCEKGYKGRKKAPSCGGVKTIQDLNNSIVKKEDVLYFNLINLYQIDNRLMMKYQKKSNLNYVSYPRKW